jgi:hypothetical protein
MIMFQSAHVHKESTTETVLDTATGLLPTFLSSEGSQASALAGAGQVADDPNIGLDKATLIGGNQQSIVKEYDLKGGLHFGSIGAVICVLHELQHHMVLGVQLTADNPGTVGNRAASK